MMGSESQVWRSLNANLIILGWMERKKDVQWCDGEAWGGEAITRGKCRVSWRAMRGVYRWFGVRYQASYPSLDPPRSDTETRIWMSAVLGGEGKKAIQGVSLSRLPLWKTIDMPHSCTT